MIIKKKTTIDLGNQIVEVGWNFDNFSSPIYFEGKKTYSRNIINKYIFIINHEALVLLFYKVSNIHILILINIIF